MIWLTAPRLARRLTLLMTDYRLCYCRAMLVHAACDLARTLLHGQFGRRWRSETPADIVLALQHGQLPAHVMSVVDEATCTDPAGPINTDPIVEPVGTWIREIAIPKA